MLYSKRYGFNKKNSVGCGSLDGATSIGLGNLYKTHPCQDSMGNSHMLKRICNQKEG